jgi:hypothetical protein
MFFYDSVFDIKEIEKTISVQVKKDILAVYNIMQNKFLLIKYVKNLLEDTGVLMMKEAKRITIR